MFEEQANLVARLALHHAQRSQSIPTLSVLLGKAIETRHLWNRWLHHVQRPTAVAVFTTKPALFQQWLPVVAAHHDLRSLVLARIARLANQPMAQLTAWFAQASDYQMELFWQHLAPASDEMVILRSLLAIVPAVQAPTRDAGESPFGWRQDADPATGFKQFATVAELLPPSSVPGLFVLLPEATAYAELRAALTSLTALVEAVPTLPVALALTGAQGQLLWEALPESKVKAMMRSGLIAIPAPEPDALRTWLHSCGVNDEDRLQPLLDLAERHGMTPDLMAAALPLLDSTAQPAAAPGAPFRSHAEWLLFQYLEANPKTVGRFQVNVQLGIDFGTHKMEVDFLDAAAKLVIELDGHYHFTELDNYRRDRRKDRLLQQHGYLVLRFLADDVVSELETIFAAIDQSLWSRQTSS